MLGTTIKLSMLSVVVTTCTLEKTLLRLGSSCMPNTKKV